MTALTDAQRDRVLERARAETHPDRDPTAIRRSVARALAAEGIVVAPAAWASMVRECTEEVSLPLLVTEVIRVAGASDRAFTQLLDALTLVAQEADR